MIFLYSSFPLRKLSYFLATMLNDGSSVWENAIVQVSLLHFELGN